MISNARLIEERAKLRKLKSKLVQNSGIEVAISRKIKLLNKAIILYRKVQG